MSWKKYFTPVTTEDNLSGSYSPFSNRNSGSQAGPARTNYSSYLPDVYVGSPNRVERYGQYNTMDLDSEVCAALDILAEFCAQVNKENATYFKFKFNKSATNAEIQIFNRWGSLIFSSSGANYNNNKWQGNFENKELPVGTYYYTINLNDGSELQTGAVTIVR